MKMFPISLAAFGLYVPMWFFALTSVLGLVYIVAFIKETKGMSLNKIDPETWVLYILYISTKGIQ